MSASRQPNINQLQAGSGQLDQDSIPNALKKEIINQSDIASRYNSINSDNDSSFLQQNYDDIINNYNLVGNFNTTDENTVSQYNNILRKIQLLTTRLNSVTTNNKKFMTNTKLRLKLILDRIYTTRLNLASIINNNNTEELRILRQRNADLTSKLTTLQSSCSATKDQLQNARQEIDRNNQRISELEKEKSRLTDKLRSTEQRYAGLRIKFQNFLASRGDDTAEIQRLTQQNLDLEEQMYEMQEQIDNLNMDLERKRQENQVLANRIAELELDLNSQITTHHNQLLEINKALDNGFSNAIANLDNNNNEIENIMKVIKEIEDELDVFDRDITTASAGGAGGGASGAGGGGAGAGGGGATNSSSSSGTSPIIPSSVPSVPSGVPTTFPSGVPTTVPSGVPTTVPSGVPTTVPSGVPSGASSGVPSGVVSAKGPDGVPMRMPSGVITNNSSGGGGPVSNATSVDPYRVPDVGSDELSELGNEFDPASITSDVSSVGQQLGSLTGPIQSGVVELETPPLSPRASLSDLVNPNLVNPNDPYDSLSSPKLPSSVRSSTSDQSSTNNQVEKEMTATDTSPLLPPFTSKTTSTKNLSGSKKFRGKIEQFISRNRSFLRNNPILKKNLEFLRDNSYQIVTSATNIDTKGITGLVQLVKILVETALSLPINDALRRIDLNFIINDDITNILIPELMDTLKSQADNDERWNEIFANLSSNTNPTTGSNKGGKMKTRMKRKRRKTQKKKK